MPLTCDCSNYEDADWIYYSPSDYFVFDKMRGKRCTCGKLIHKGDTCARFERHRQTRGEIEEKIYGEVFIEIAPIYLCERCADLWFSFDALGFCVSPDENMMELIDEYKHTYIKKQV